MRVASGALLGISFALLVSAGVACAKSGNSAAGASVTSHLPSPTDTNVSHWTVSYQNDGSSTPETVPGNPHMGDRRTNQWFTPTPGGGYQEHTETDRFQSPNAPISGPPDDGSGQSPVWVEVSYEEHTLTSDECSKLLHVDCVAV